MERLYRQPFFQLMCPDPEFPHQDPEFSEKSRMSLYWINSHIGRSERIICHNLLFISQSLFDFIQYTNDRPMSSKQEASNQTLWN